MDFNGHDIRALLLGSFHTAVDICKPAGCLPRFLPPVPSNGKTYVIGAGKASAEMARVFEEHYEGDYEGIVLTRYGFGVPTKTIRIIEGAHPVPDYNGLKAVDDIIAMLAHTTQYDLVVCLLSGGGSALLTAPVDGVSLSDLQRLYKQLLMSGAAIGEMNTVRKHLNRALGGGLAAAAVNPKLVTLAISDVAGNDPSVIASGPTVADPSTLQDCFHVIEKYGIEIPDSILLALNDPQNETPKDGEAIFSNNEYHMIATPEECLAEAQKYWEQKGFRVDILGSQITGDTNAAALKHVERARDIQKTLKGGDAPVALLSGGETTVKITGQGRGGPNTQFALQAAIALEGNQKICGASFDTDGIDGSDDATGAYFMPETLGRAEGLRCSPQDFLDDNDSYSFYKETDDLIITGPTQTNVNDYRVVLIFP